MSHRSRSQKRASKVRHLALMNALVVVESIPEPNPNPAYWEFSVPAETFLGTKYEKARRVVDPSTPSREDKQTGWYRRSIMRRDVVVGALRAQVWTPRDLDLLGLSELPVVR